MGKEMRFSLKKSRLLPIVFGSAVMIAACCAVAAANGSFPWNAMKWQTDSGEAVEAYVNGEPILKKTLDKAIGDTRKMEEITARLFPSKQKSSKSESEVLDDLIKAKVLKQEAEKEGITVTDRDALDSLRATDRQIQDLMENGSEEEKKNAKESWDTLTSVASALHESMDQYEKNAVPTERNILIQNRLYQKYVAGHSSMTETKQEMWDGHVAELMKKADVKHRDSP
ncbi:SurA N-terminal domain-containing protein [Caproicibacter sp. BJN0012]|uniref:SurA N-terminal domain-containing protein n=1 Tax=Caproicibacter sp. BJN0012 TaxID=3110227 RepID=UPI002E0EC021